VFNTPSLRGLALTAPYLHDGSAATLEQVLDRTANTMGHAGSLQPGQRADLIAYLRSL
jgi:cytochrome c peroxidase